MKQTASRNSLTQIVSEIPYQKRYIGPGAWIELIETLVKKKQKTHGAEKKSQGDDSCNL